MIGDSRAHYSLADISLESLRCLGMIFQRHTGQSQCLYERLQRVLLSVVHEGWLRHAYKSMYHPQSHTAWGHWKENLVLGYQNLQCWKSSNESQVYNSMPYKQKNLQGFSLSFKIMFPYQHGTSEVAKIVCPNYMYFHSKIITAIIPTEDHILSIVFLLSL